MLKNNAFIKKEYRNIVLGVIMFYLFSCIAETTDIMIAGHYIGEMGVAAVEIVNPLYSLFAAVALLFSIGFQIEHSNSLGRADPKEGEKYFGRSVTASVVMGIFICVGLILFRDKYLEITGCSGELYEMAKDYYTFFPYMGLFYSVYYILSSLCENDGDTKRLAVSALVFLSSNAVISIVLIKYIGITGLGLGTVIGSLIQTVVIGFHLFKKTSSVKKFVFGINLSGQLKMAKDGLFASMGYVLIALVDVIMHKVILNMFDNNALTAYSMVNFFYSYVILFEALTNSGISIIGVYDGEGNHKGVKKTIKYTLRALIMMGILYSIVFIAGADIMPVLIGIREPSVSLQIVKTSVLIGSTSVFVAAIYLPMEIYSCIGHPNFSMLLSVLTNGVFPLLLGTCLGKLFGYYGLCVGVALSPLAAIIIGFILIRIRAGKDGFPYYLGKENYVTHMFVTETGRDFSEILDTTSKKLGEINVSDTQINHIRLLLEELITNIESHNVGKKVMIELSVLADENNINLVIRDNGEYFDINDFDTKIDSLSAYVMPLIISKERLLEHVISASSNRNQIVIPRT